MTLENDKKSVMSELYTNHLAGVGMLLLTKGVGKI